MPHNWGPLPSPLLGSWEAQAALAVLGHGVMLPDTPGLGKQRKQLASLEHVYSLYPTLELFISEPNPLIISVRVENACKTLYVLSHASCLCDLGVIVHFVTQPCYSLQGSLTLPVLNRAAGTEAAAALKRLPPIAADAGREAGATRRAWMEGPRSACKAGPILLQHVWPPPEHDTSQTTRDCSPFSELQLWTQTPVASQMQTQSGWDTN